MLQEFLGAIRPAGWIVTYECLEGEVDLSSLRRDSDLGSFALTRTPAGGGPLTLHPADIELERHRYGFAQPVATAPTVADTAVSVVLVPGLAFDRQGARLGWGEGHYDRFLSRLASSVLRVGVTGGSVVDRLPVDPHDVAMTHLATDVAVVGVERR